VLAGVAIAVGLLAFGAVALVVLLVQLGSRLFG
jgi:hypothetical protein